MAKASSPVRLEEGLMKAATTAGITLHRSAAEQVEYWADIGRKVADIVDPNKLLAVKAGLAKIRIEETESVSIDPDAVFAALDRDRESGALAQAVASGSVRYQASLARPGKLEACYPDGRVELGQFQDGQFIAEQ
ncbi:MAG: ParD-like family protein [Cellvibrionaceae bacterium]|nr:ParD-like family protein [Cellvibrionaceae bacterium]MCV6625746.1 ParD-like family protein [Cellvibrionaceae bacterium]